MKKYNKIPISHFETFYKLIIHGSFTNTAKALGVTKAAISHSIKLLEKELKIDLINRSTRSISLTHEGKLLFAHCSSLQSEIENVRDIAKSFHSEPSGTLKISTNLFFANNFLLQIIKDYSNKFPKVRIDVSVEEKMPDLKRQQVDVVFGVNWTPPDDIIARKISSTRYILCASPEYLKKNGTPKNLNDLSEHSYIPHKSRTSAIVSTIKTTDFKIQKPFLTTDNIEFMKECVLNGLGIGQFHEYIVKKEINDGKLIELLKREFYDHQNIYMYYQKNKFVQPKVKKFVNLVLDSSIF